MTRQYRRAGQDEFTRIYNAGLDEECRVLAFLENKGFTVQDATKEEQFLDIDCYLDGVPTSIKAEHDGLKYGDIYFELASQKGSAKFLRTLSLPEFNSIQAWAAKAKRQNVPSDLLEYFSAWFFTGTAEQYLILQGDRLRLYRKSDIMEYMDKFGPDKVLGLSPYRLQTQGGKNTICAFVKSDAVRFSELTLPQVGNA